ncbi:shikimate dehydrogenase [Microbacterium sp. KHB019]|uniref:shikimate dehydrogenase n=1 Tax=Microbacterium sp. KHB019 TaxID=3129770 RepID=UPI00307A084B
MPADRTRPPATAMRFAVWGDPIEHSKSPQLHEAAYRALGLDWQYDRRQVAAAGFGDALAGLDDTWRGLSLTMPLKEQGYLAAVTRDRHAELTGAVNTLLLGDASTGFNTDVGGIIDALAEQGITRPRSVRILGAGATAASALVAASEIGGADIDIRARRPERSAPLVELGSRLGIRVTANTFDAPATPVDLTIATLPSGTVLDESVSEELATHGGALFDVAYAPWPSALGAVWTAAPVISGLGMLLHQALRQVRVFLHGDPAVELPEEQRVLAAMRDAL